MIILQKDYSVSVVDNRADVRLPNGDVVFCRLLGEGQYEIYDSEVEFPTFVTDILRSVSRILG